MIIGIDPALTCTGLSSGEVTGVVKSEPEDVGDPVTATITRCRRIMSCIDIWLLGLGGKAAYNFFIEGPAFHDANHLLEMGIWYASFYQAFHGTPNTITIIAPATLKKFISGKGNLPKSEVPLQVYKKWKVEFAKDKGADQAHAFALFKLGEAICDGKYTLEPQQRRGSGNTAKSATRRAHRNHPI